MHPARNRPEPARCRHRPCTPAAPPGWRQIAEPCPADGGSLESWRGDGDLLADRVAGLGPQGLDCVRASRRGLPGLITQLAAIEDVSVRQVCAYLCTRDAILALRRTRLALFAKPLAWSARTRRTHTYPIWRQVPVGRHAVRAAPERAFCCVGVCRYSPPDPTGAATRAGERGGVGRVARKVMATGRDNGDRYRVQGCETAG